MADEQKKIIILGVELDLSQMVRAAQEGRKTLDELKAKQKELITQGKENSVEFEANAAAIREANVEYREVKKNIDNAIISRKAEAGSIEQMRADLAIATKEYNLLGAATRDSTKEGEALRNKIKGLSDELKKNESAIGDNRRNVGDYAGAIQKTLSGLNLMPGALGNASTAVSGLGDAFKILLANPIVLVISAIVAGLGALYKAFTSTGSGALAVKVIFEQLSAIVGVIVQRVATFAQGIVEIFKGNFLEGATKMVGAFTGIADQISKAVDAAGTYVRAMEELRQAQIDFITDTAKTRNEVAKLLAFAADAGNSLAARKDALKKAIDLEKQDVQERQKLAQDNFDNEVEKSAGLVGLEKSKLKELLSANHESSVELLANDKHLADARDKLGDDRFEELKKLLAAITDLDSEFFETNKRNIGKLSALQLEADTKRRESIAKTLSLRKDALQLDIDYLDKNFKDAEQLQSKHDRDLLKLQIELAENQRDIELNAKDLTTKQKQQIDDNYNSAKTKLIKQAFEDEKAITAKALKDRFKLIEDFSEKENASFAENIIKRSIANEKDRADRIAAGENEVIVEQDYQATLLQIQIDSSQQSALAKQTEIDDKLLYVRQGSEEEIALLKEKQAVEDKIASDSIAAKLQQTKTALALKKKQTEAELEIDKEVFGNLKSLFAEGSVAYKAFAALEISASTASAAIGAYAKAVETYPPPAGQIIGGISVAAAIAVGAQQLAKVQGLKKGGIVARAIKYAFGGIIGDKDKGITEVYPKAAKGILLGGQPHSRGGTKFVGSDGTKFEAEEGELLTVVNKNSTNLLRSLSSLNVAGGGTSFFKDGGIVNNFLQDGGFALRAAASPVTNNFNAAQQSRDILRGLKLAVAVQDINEGVDSLATVEDRAEII